MVVNADKKTSHLVPTWQDIDVLQSIHAALSPLCSLTDIQKYVTASAVSPMVHLITQGNLLMELNTNTQLTKDIKQRVKSDLGNRYSSDLEIVDILSTASFLYPRYKTKNMEQEDIRLLKERLVDECSSDFPPTTSGTQVIQDGPPPAKKKNLGSFFKDRDKSVDETAMPVISPEQQIVSELDAYLSSPKLYFADDRNRTFI